MKKSEFEALVAEARDNWLARYVKGEASIITDVQNTLDRHISNIMLSHVGINRTWNDWEVKRTDSYGHEYPLYTALRANVKKIVESVIVKIPSSELSLSKDEQFKLTEAARKKYMEIYRETVLDMVAERAEEDAKSLLEEITFDDVEIALKKPVKSAVAKRNSINWSNEAQDLLHDER